MLLIINQRKKKTINLLFVHIDGRLESDLTIPDYNNMQYFDRFIKETLRLYPPVPFMGRELIEPLSVGDGQVELPIGTQVHVHTFDLHRDPDQFPEPEKFDPDRFLPEQKDRRHPLAYLAFSAGPRNCIGILNICCGYM